MKRMKIALLLLVLLPALSCIWGKKQWEQLADRTFYFQKFRYVYKGASEQQAFNYMKAFPLRDVAAALEKRYNITVDTSEFEQFIAANDPMKLKLFRLIQKEEFYWVSADYKSKERKPNGVEFHFITTFGEELTSVNRGYKLLLRTGSSVRALYADMVDEPDAIPRELIEKINR